MLVSCVHLLPIHSVPFFSTSFYFFPLYLSLCLPSDYLSLPSHITLFLFIPLPHLSQLSSYMHLFSPSFL